MFFVSLWFIFRCREKQATICSVRAYIKLLRLPYQLQLGPIFGLGVALSHFAAPQAAMNWPRVLAIFVLLHVCCFGGLTALNSHYDRDEGPIGGLWNAPKPPPRLFAFAWIVQILGFVAMLFFSFCAALIYAMIALLALGYSHPKTRWKGHPTKSICVVAVGQGALDFCAGVLAVREIFSFSQAPPALIFGLCGATFSTIAFYPLTQLFQTTDDAQRGDKTIAIWLLARGGRRALFAFCATFFLVAFGYHALALLQIGELFLARVLALGSLALLGYLWFWSRENSNARRDFLRVHRLLRVSSLAFAGLLALLFFR